MPDLKLNSPLQYVKGVGPKKAAALALQGYQTVADILYYFPRQYLDRTETTPIGSANVDSHVTIIGEVKAHGVLYGGRRRYEIILEDESGAISLLFFQGVKYYERSIKKGQRFAATGTVSHFQGRQIVHPEMERLDSDSDSMVHAGRIIPVYPQTAELSKVGLSGRGIRTVTSFIFEHLKDRPPELLPKGELAKNDLIPLPDALVQIHFPDNQDQIEVARRRLAYDELLKIQFYVFENKGRREGLVKKHRYKKPGKKLSAFKTGLPFDLTKAQKKVVREIFDDLQTERPMARLLQGDVGCGKTVVAILAALYAAENGLQCSLMAPTEILAEQHYRNYKESLEEVHVSSALLTSSLKAADKRNIAEACAAGDIDILFGTHALIYDYVQFARLGLVIIDEQHRFGVRQRGKLYAKGESADLLAMTATPIPRTLALTLYGDLDIGTIDALPPGRKPIRTVWRDQAVRDKVYSFIVDEVTSGGQAYIIYPLVEKSDQVELENVEDAFKALTTGAFKNVKVGMVHGRVKPEKRDKVLTDFRDKKIDALLATTVIEVGIDNPNATVMVIEHAERFGLAQLHQLRGRVGRGSRQSTVVAVAHHPVSDIARQRMQYFVDSNDGFEIAEADLQLRGPGEMFGSRQSGTPEFRVANAWTDRDLLETARSLVARLFTERDQLDRGYLRLYKSLVRTASGSRIELGGG